MTIEGDISCRINKQTVLEYLREQLLSSNLMTVAGDISFNGMSGIIMD